MKQAGYPKEELFVTKTETCSWGHRREPGSSDPSISVGTHSTISWHQSIQEVLQYPRDNGFKTYIVTERRSGLRARLSERVYEFTGDARSSRWSAPAGGTKYAYDKEAKPFLH
jgi:hypothetical protein